MPYFISLGPIGDALIVSDLGAFAAGVALLLGFVLYLWAPRKYLQLSAAFLYLLIAGMTALLIFSTGEANSAFISLWIVISVFASVFGLFGVVPLLSAIAGFEAYTILQAPTLFPTSTVIVIAIGGLTPLIASYIIFHTRPKHGDKEDTAYHELTNELNQETNKSATVIHAIDEGVIAVNAQGVIELINPAAERIIGWGGNDAIGLDYKSVLKLSDRSDKPLTDANDPVVSVLSTNKDVHTKDFSVSTNGGKRLILSLVISPIGQLGEGAIIVFRDITKEQAEEREQTEFISTASHEMRTPVASIEGYLGLALNPNTAQVDEKARDFITKAHESAQHLGRLFQDLLDVTKADDGRLSNKPGIVDVISFIGTIVEGLTPKAQEKQLRLFYVPNPDTDAQQRTITPVFYANVDNDHLREVVQNLIENAIKYTPQGDVIVDVGGDEEHVTISIKDSGIGIPKEDIPHLFQKFYRVDNSATREIGGTGLGLYLCRRLSEIMGGRIWVESEFKKGSTFFLEIPRLDREEAMRIMESSTEPTAPPIAAAHPPTPPQEQVQPVASSDTQPIVPDSPQQTPQAPTPAATQTPPAITATPNDPVASPVQPQPSLATIEQDAATYAQQSRSANRISIPIRETHQNG